jgi:hypothetical protein
LTLKHELGREYYDAGLEYGSLCRHFFVAHGINLDFSEGHRGQGLGVAPSTARKLGNELERIEPVLQRLDRAGFSSLKTLCVHERAIDAREEPGAVIVLLELGRLLRKTGRPAPCPSAIGVRPNRLTTF